MTHNSNNIAITIANELNIYHMDCLNRGKPPKELAPYITAITASLLKEIEVELNKLEVRSKNSLIGHIKVGYDNALAEVRTAIKGLLK